MLFSKSYGLFPTLEVVCPGAASSILMLALSLVSSTLAVGHCCDRGHCPGVLHQGLNHHNCHYGYHLVVFGVRVDGAIISQMITVGVHIVPSIGVKNTVISIVMMTRGIVPAASTLIPP